MKKSRKSKLQYYETLSDSEMKNIIGADYDIQAPRFMQE